MLQCIRIPFYKNKKTFNLKSNSQNYMKKLQHKMKKYIIKLNYCYKKKLKTLKNNYQNFMNFMLMIKQKLINLNNLGNFLNLQMLENYM